MQLPFRASRPTDAPAKIFVNGGHRVYVHSMAAGLFPPRRWYGLLCLILGASMLVWGQTVLANRLQGKTFIIYWTLCFLVTSLALIFALWESRRLRLKLREEEKALFKEMLHQIDLARRRKEEEERQNANLATDDSAPRRRPPATS